MSHYSLIDFFCDPVLRASTIGSMLMGLSAALIGAILLVERRSLIGEALSHAAYPGILLAPLLAAQLKLPFSYPLLITAFVGALVATWVGARAVNRYQHQLKISPDVSLAIVSSLFLGLGVLFASRLQFVDPKAYQHLQTLLYGQVTTMTDGYLIVYALFGLVCLGSIAWKFRQIELALFDRQFAAALAFKRRGIDRALLLLLILSVIFGIRSVGVILMSGMLIAPPIAARQLTNRFSHLLIISGCFGVLSAFSGNVLALYLPMWFGSSSALPTGPVIILTSAFFCVATLLFAPKRGALFRLVRALRFRLVCLSENVLKTLWKEGAHRSPIQLERLAKWQNGPSLFLFGALAYLRLKGLIFWKKGNYALTRVGELRAAQLIRLHRLWELYLTSELHIDQARVHRSAEEMEHILTPALEEKLTKLLNDPKIDPHKQPIPKWEDVQC